MLNKEEEEKGTLNPAQMITEEKDKHRALLAGIIFFMALIVILWVLNSKNIFKRTPLDEKGGLIDNIDKFSQDFQTSIDEFGAKTTELKKNYSKIVNGSSTEIKK